MANELTLEGLAARLEQVERLNRSFRWMAVATILFALAGFALVMESKVSKTVTAETFAVRNANGNIVAALSSSGDGRPYLALNYEKRIAASLLIGPDGQPVLTFSDDQENLRASFGIGKDGSPALLLSDAQRQVRLNIAVYKVPTISLADSNKVVRWSAAADADGAHVSTFDAAGKKIAAQP
jgi:hypothetical protein